MRLGIDARWIRPDASGIGTYTTRLVEHLAPLAAPQHTIVLFFDDASTRRRTLDAASLREGPGLESVLVPFGPLSLASQLRFPGALTRHRIELFHSTNYMIPLVGGPPSIATIHDLIPLLFPTQRARAARLRPMFTWSLRRVARKARRILTVSEASARDVERCLGLRPIDTQKLETIPGGVGPEFRAIDRTDRGPGPRTILYVGRSDPHKNLSGLVRAFAEIRDRLDFEVRLVVVGPEDPRFPEARTLAAALGIEGAVQWRGEIDADGLRDAYRDADVLCLPSLYEGFGLPALEAMASGTAVVCSDRGGLPEVVGEAALQFSPAEPDQLPAALLAALTDREATARRVEAGVTRAAAFTWERTARDTLRVYEEVAAESATTRS